MTKEQRLWQVASPHAKAQVCPDCGVVCVQRLTAAGMSFLCVDCEEDPKFIPATRLATPYTLSWLKAWGL